MRPFLPDPSWRLSAIIESTNDAIFSKALDGTVTSWNGGAERLFGYSAAEAIGQSIQLVLPSDRKDEEAELRARIENGERIPPFDSRRRRKDGMEIDVSLTLSPIRDASGHIVGTSTIARDITARKHLEADRDDFHRRLMALIAASTTIVGSPDVAGVNAATVSVSRDLFEADACAVWRLDASGTWRAVHSWGLSDAFDERLLGAAPAHAPLTYASSDPEVCDDVTGLPPKLCDVYRQEGIACFMLIPLIIAGKRSALGLYFRTSRQVSALDVQLAGALASLASASLTTAELYEEQRTARHAADQAGQRAAFLAKAGAVLSASLDYEATLRAVAELAVPTIGDWCGVDMIAEGGRVQRLAVAHVDPAKVETARMLQERYPADPNAPGGIHEALRTQRPTYMSRIPPALIEASARDEEHRRILRDLKLTSYMCVPIVAYGKALGAITFVSSDSGREYGAADLRLGQELAARAAMAIQNAKLYAQASEASQLKDDFLATLSHELRTPLNAVLGYARILRMGTMPLDRLSGAIEVIERNAHALQQIIEDVLDVSRIVTGRLRLHVEPVDLPSVLREALATVTPAAEARGLRLEVVIEPLTTPVSGDAGRLQQIFWNLLANAVKFTDRGGKVQLRLARVNSHVEITVSDTGRGIDPAFLPFVFDRFRQEDARMSREHGGLGLGLAIAKQLTELHGGSILVASDGVGRGATFIVQLPLMIVHARPASSVPDVHPAAEGVPPASEPTRRLDGLRVLAVDDEPDSLSLLRTVLEGAGATVYAAESGRAALGAIRSWTPDVLVADIGMPELDGLQLIRAVRQLEEPWRNIPAAALTAYARKQDRIATLGSGFQMHLSKPIEPLELIMAVATLDRRTPRESAQP